MKLSACIEMMMHECTLPERIERVKEAGLPGFEFWGWGNKDIPALVKAMETTGLEAAAFCTSGSNLVDPSAHEDYLAALEQTIPVAQQLNVNQLIATTGQQRPGTPRSEQKQAVIDGLKLCAPTLKQHDMTLVLEPLNILVDHQGYFLYHAHEAFDIVQAVGSSHVKVLYDIYHQQITEGNLIPTIRSSIEMIGHFHVADHPGRNEPGTGEINYRSVFAAIEETGYNRWVGLEFKPTIDPVTALKQVVALAP